MAAYPVLVDALLLGGICVGGFLLLSAGSLFCCYLDFHDPSAENRMVNAAVEAVLGGLAAFVLGLWQLRSRFRRISPVSS